MEKRRNKKHTHTVFVHGKTHKHNTHPFSFNLRVSGRELKKKAAFFGAQIQREGERVLGVGFRL
jgi:hypothetical protein